MASVFVCKPRKVETCFKDWSLNTSKCGFTVYLHYGLEINRQEKSDSSASPNYKKPFDLEWVFGEVYFSFSISNILSFVAYLDTWQMKAHTTDNLWPTYGFSLLLVSCSKAMQYDPATFRELSLALHIKI